MGILEHDLLASLREKEAQLITAEKRSMEVSHMVEALKGATVRMEKAPDIDIFISHSSSDKKLVELLVELGEVLVFL